MRPILWLCVACAATSPRAFALEVDTAIVSHAGEAYEIAIDARLAAPPERVLEVLTDYARLPELHDRIVESRVLGHPAPDATEVFTRFQGCVLFICRTLARTEVIRRTAGGLEAQDVPGRSAFREGHTRWIVMPDGTGSRISYRSRLVPDFWVPALLGPKFIGRSVKQMTLETLAAVEARSGTAPVEAREGGS